MADGSGGWKRDAAGAYLRNPDTVDAAAKKVVDDTVKGLMSSGELAKMYAKWFTGPIPPRGNVVGMPMSESLKKAIANPNDNPAESYKK